MDISNLSFVYFLTKWGYLLIYGLDHMYCSRGVASEGMGRQRQALAGSLPEPPLGAAHLHLPARSGKDRDEHGVLRRLADRSDGGGSS